MRVLRNAFVLVPCLLALATARSATAGGPEIVISALAASEWSPAIAYNSVQNEYLVVWENMWGAGLHDIYGQRVAASGDLIESAFVVSSGARSRIVPSVAFDPVHDRYLVTWLYDFWGNGTDFDVYGRFVPWEGPIPSLLEFSICNWSSSQGHAAVAFSLAQGEFFSVWTDYLTGSPSTISGRRISADGTGFPDAGITLSSGAENRDMPALAYNQARNEYVVTWDIERAGSGLDIEGVRLSGTGSVLGTTISIAGWPDVEERPGIAACPAANQYLVVWQSDQGTGGSDSAIYGRYLNGTGVPGNVYLIDDTSLPELHPRVACNGAGNRYLVVDQSKYVSLKFGIWGRIAHPNETFGPSFEIAPAYGDMAVPFVAGGPTDYLVAWEHESGLASGQDIHGRFAWTALFSDGFELGSCVRWARFPA